jgi:cysteine desulfurase
MDLKRPIYMDCHATTPVDPRVLDAMLPFYREHFGNASSRTHSFGWVAEEAVETARKQVAALLGATAREIVFTSGATESIHIALRGCAQARRAKGRHIVTTNIEHKAVAETLQGLEAEGFEVTRVAVDPDGLVAVEDVRQALRPDTILLAVMAANNEIGTVQPVGALGKLAQANDTVFFVDAAQAVGKIGVDVVADQIDLMALSAHKLYGPKGVGALYVRRRLRLDVTHDGGGQERGLRSGTLNVAGIVGLGAACALSAEEMPHESRRIAGLRDTLWQGLQSRIDDVQVNGSLQSRLAGNLNVSFAGVQGESLLMQMNDIAVSPGAACDSANSEPSHVLRAIGLADDLARSTIRFGLGRFNVAEEVEYAIDKVADAVSRLRKASPLYES